MTSPDENIFTKEIESRKGFEYALRQPNATLFKRMLTECLESEEYAAAFKTNTTRLCRVTVYGPNIPTTENDKQVNKRDFR